MPPLLTDTDFAKPSAPTGGPPSPSPRLDAGDFSKTPTKPAGGLLNASDFKQPATSDGLLSHADFAPAPPASPAQSPDAQAIIAQHQQAGAQQRMAMGMPTQEQLPQSEDAGSVRAGYLNEYGADAARGLVGTVPQAGRVLSGALANVGKSIDPLGLSVPGARADTANAALSPQNVADGQKIFNEYVAQPPHTGLGQTVQSLGASAIESAPVLAGVAPLELPAVGAQFVERGVTPYVGPAAARVVGGVRAALTGASEFATADATTRAAAGEAPASDIPKAVVSPVTDIAALVRHPTQATPGQVANALFVGMGALSGLHDYMTVQKGVEKFADDLTTHADGATVGQVKDLIDAKAATGDAAAAQASKAINEAIAKKYQKIVPPEQIETAPEQSQNKTIAPEAPVTPHERIAAAISDLVQQEVAKSQGRGEVQTSTPVSPEQSDNSPQAWQAPSLPASGNAAPTQPQVRPPIQPSAISPAISQAGATGVPSTGVSPNQNQAGSTTQPSGIVPSPNLNAPQPPAASGLPKTTPITADALAELTRQNTPSGVGNSERVRGRNSDTLSIPEAERAKQYAQHASDNPETEDGYHGYMATVLKTIAGGELKPSVDGRTHLVNSNDLNTGDAFDIDDHGVKVVNKTTDGSVTLEVKQKNNPYAQTHQFTIDPNKPLPLNKGSLQRQPENANGPTQQTSDTRGPQSVSGREAEAVRPQLGPRDQGEADAAIERHARIAEGLKSYLPPSITAQPHADGIDFKLPSGDTIKGRIVPHDQIGYDKQAWLESLTSDPQYSGKPLLDNGKPVILDGRRVRIPRTPEEFNKMLPSHQAAIADRIQPAGAYHRDLDEARISKDFADDPSVWEHEVVGHGGFARMTPEEQQTATEQHGGEEEAVSGGVRPTSDVFDRAMQGAGSETPFTNRDVAGQQGLYGQGKVGADTGKQNTRDFGKPKEEESQPTKFNITPQDLQRASAYGDNPSPAFAHGVRDAIVNKRDAASQPQGMTPQEIREAAQGFKAAKAGASSETKQDIEQAKGREAQGKGDRETGRLFNAVRQRGGGGQLPPKFPSMEDPPPPPPPPEEKPEEPAPPSPIDRARSAVKDLAQRFKDYTTIDPIPKLVRAGAGDAAVEHASAKIAGSHIVDDLLSKAFPTEYHNPEAMAKTMDVLNKDNILGGYDTFIKKGETALKGIEEQQKVIEKSKAELLPHSEEGAAIRAKAFSKISELTKEADAAEKSARAIAKAHDLAKYDADVQDALKDTAISANVERWKSKVNPELNRLYNELRRVDPETERDGRGLHTGARINLLPDNEAQRWKEFVGDKEGKPMPESSGGSYRNPNVKYDPTMQAASFTGKYSNDAKLILSRVVGPRWNEVTKLRLYDALTKAGAAKEIGPNEKPPETIGGEQAVQLPTKLPRPNADSSAREERAIYVKKSLVGEVRNVLNTDQRLQQNPVGKVLTAIQLMQIADAATHAHNISVVIAHAQGSSAAWKDVVRQLPVLGSVDGVARIASVSREVLADTPEIRAEKATMAKQGLLRPEFPATGIQKITHAQQFLHHADTAARVIMNRFYDSLVDRGMAPDTDEGRRNYVNQIGQYNGRLMGQLMNKARESWLSPFVVAGRNFNRIGRRILTGNPGFESTTTSGAWKARLTQLLGGVVGTTAAVMMLNSITTGNPAGRKGTPLGAWDTGHDGKDGKRLVVDLAQLTGLRRGLNSTGIGPFLESMNMGRDGNATSGQVVSSQLSAAMHPWLGPAPAFISKVVTGKQFDLRGRMEARQYPKGGGRQYLENFRAALESQNLFIYSMARPLFQKAGLDEKPTTPTMVGDFLKPYIGETAGDTVGQVASTLAKSPLQGSGIKSVKPTDAAHELLDQFYSSTLPRARPVPSEEQALRSSLTQRSRSGDDVSDDIAKAVSSGKMTTGQADSLQRTLKIDPDILHFKTLPGVAEARQVWDHADDDFKTKLLPAYINKELNDRVASGDQDAKATHSALTRITKEVKDGTLSKDNLDQVLTYVIRHGGIEQLKGAPEPSKDEEDPQGLVHDLNQYNKKQAVNRERYRAQAMR